MEVMALLEQVGPEVPEVTDQKMIPVVDTTLGHLCRLCSHPGPDYHHHLENASQPEASAVEVLTVLRLRQNHHQGYT